jgi:hypothetical protein
MQRYTVLLYLETALHISLGTSTHHQEHIQLYLQHLLFVTLLLPPDDDNTVVYAPDDGWRYHPKHVEQFPDIIKLCNVASCSIYIGIVCIIYLTLLQTLSPTYILWACLLLSKFVGKFSVTVQYFTRLKTTFLKSFSLNQGHSYVSRIIRVLLCLQEINSAKIAQVQ